MRVKSLIWFNRLPFFAALLFAIVANASAAPVAARPARVTPPKIGQRPPPFTLRDHHGRRVTLGDATGASVVLVFYRGYW